MFFAKKNTKNGNLKWSKLIYPKKYIKQTAVKCFFSITDDMCIIGITSCMHAYTFINIYLCIYDYTLFDSILC